MVPTYDEIKTRTRTDEKEDNYITKIAFDLN